MTKSSSRCGLTPNPFKCKVENMETRNVAQGTQLVIGNRKLGQRILPNKEKITVEGVNLKATLLVNELNLPFKGFEIPNKCVNTLLKKLNIVFSTTKETVKAQPLPKVTISVT